MFDFRTAFYLITHSFSFKKGSLRFPSFKRLFFVFFVLPLFFFNTLINWIFLWLDELIFLSYHKTDLSKSVFIIGMPRSGTSFLLNLICANKKDFTCFSLGEMVFAPSIIQKYFYRIFSKLDEFVGKPLKKSILFIEKFLFKSTKGVHDISFFANEEDEFLYLFLFRSIYLQYIFPDVERKLKLLNRDELNNTKSGQQMMRFYTNCVKRHNYFYNKSGHRYFVSKNPAYPGMIDLLSSNFPDSYFINPVRNQKDTFASTLSLNNRLLSGACSVKESQPLKEITIASLLKWDEKLKSFCKNSSFSSKILNLDFLDLTKNPFLMVQEIYKLLNIEMNQSAKDIYLAEENKSKRYKSPHNYESITLDEIKNYKTNLANDN